MSAQADQITLPAPLRWLVLPAVGWALMTTAFEALRRRAREPKVSPMSEQWLRQHDVEPPQY
jgi:hypothetical protein